MPNALRLRANRQIAMVQTETLRARSHRHQTGASPSAHVPVKTTSESRGMSTSIFLRLCWRAPFTGTNPARSVTSTLPGVRLSGETLRLHFRGKSGQDHDITLRDRRLAGIVKRCQDLPGQELFQYRSEAGELAAVDSADVNEYLREITGEQFTAKGFRTWHGTGHMAQLLSALGPGGSEPRRKRNIVEAVKETAKHLGNRPAACRKFYIHPAVLEGHEAQTLFAAMRTRSKNSAAMAALRPFEIATLRLVQSYYAPREGRRRAS